MEKNIFTVPRLLYTVFTYSLRILCILVLGWQCINETERCAASKSREDEPTRVMYNAPAACVV